MGGGGLRLEVTERIEGNISSKDTFINSLPITTNRFSIYLEWSIWRPLPCYFSHTEFNFFSARWPDGRREQKGINLVCYGDPNGYTAMAKTVGYPCAIATKMVSALLYENLSVKKTVFRTHDILVWTRIRIRGSMPLTNGSGFGFGPESWFRILLFSSLTFKMQAKN